MDNFNRRKLSYIYIFVVIIFIIIGYCNFYLLRKFIEISKENHVLLLCINDNTAPLKIQMTKPMIPVIEEIPFDVFDVEITSPAY